MALFKFGKKDKKEVEKNAPVEVKPEAEKAAPAGPSIRDVKVPAAKEASAESKPAAKSTAKPATKSAPAKAPAAKPAAKAAAKPAAKKTANVSAPPASSPRPFFTMTTEEDIRVAFDQAIADADAEILRNNSKAVGKYEFDLEVDGYHFYLIANNGQVLFDSPSFTTLLGALGGVKTFKKAVAEGKFEVKVDKYNRYRFILANKYYGENYTSRDQCQKCVESVKKFASNAKILRFTATKEAIDAYEMARNSKRTPDDIDWKAVERAEAQAQKMGRFEICQEDNKHYCFYLTANNGQILYSSRYYASESACRNGIDSFKRAAYVGNFFVDRDKFGHYRYVLKNIGSAPAFIGESYDNKPQCEKIIDSVKKFIVSASIELEQKEG
ncbi:MAG: DUF1508 domain-containing protein [Clostridia bacterium]|nr:DUF1508 domain-containing protein [Clostridia bacterium]